jgi:hypothetical protein
MKTRIFTLATAVVFGLQLSANELWPIILGETVGAKVENAVVASLAPNDETNFLYIWSETYTPQEATGLNFYGDTDGYLALKVGNSGWSGAGFCLTESGTSWQDANALRQKIVANPDNYYLHLAIKSTDNYSHKFYLFGNESVGFVLGPTAVYNGTIYDDFDRDGEWHGFFIPMSQFADALQTTSVAAGVNVFVFLSEGVQGAQLNLDAVYFCDKEFMENEYTLQPGGEPVIPAENRNVAVEYLDKQNEVVRSDVMTFHFPSVPLIDGFEFVGWKPADEIIGDTLSIQAVYKRTAEGMPAVVANPSNPSQKLIRNGQMYILRDDKVYTLKGEQVK